MTKGAKNRILKVVRVRATESSTDSQRPAETRNYLVLEETYGASSQASLPGFIDVPCKLGICFLCGISSWWRNLFGKFHYEEVDRGTAALIVMRAGDE
jgi:hypothetical protein